MERIDADRKIEQKRSITVSPEIGFTQKKNFLRWKICFRLLGAQHLGRFWKLFPGDVAILPVKNGRMLLRAVSIADLILKTQVDDNNNNNNRHHHRHHHHHQSSIINHHHHQSSIINHQSSIIHHHHHQSSIINHQSSSSIGAQNQFINSHPVPIAWRNRDDHPRKNLGTDRSSAPNTWLSWPKTSPVLWRSGLNPIPSGYVKIAIENGPFIVDFPIKNGDFPSLC